MPIADPGAGAATPAPPLSVKEQEDSLKDGDGIISPLTFPDPPVSVGYVEAMASGLRELGTSIADTGNDITGSWAGLSAHYSAPEAETLFSVLDPVATDGDTVGEELDRVARALENFAEDVADIKTRWSNLRVEAYDLRSRIAAEGDDWDKGGGFLGFGDAPLKEENDALVEQGRTIITDYTEVENTCANAINAGISGRTNFEKQPEGDAELDPNVFYHGFDQDLSELAEAWGHESAQTDHGWWVDVSHAVWDFGVDAVQGVGAMVGAHSSEGWFQASWGDALKEYHWDNLTSAASLVGMYDAESDSLGWNGGEGVGEAWKDLAHSVVPWEEWGDRPGYVIGTAALNVIGLVGGAALTATGVGAVVGVPLMAWRGMSIVDGMGGSGRGGAGGVDIDLPDVSHVPQFGGSGSPLINLAGRALDATGFGPSQLADFKAMVNRLMPSGHSGVEPAGSASTQTAGEAAGGGRGSAQTVGEADPRSIRRPVQVSATADSGGSSTAAAGDATVFIEHGAGEADGGRSAGARPVQATAEVEQRPTQRPAQDPTVGDALVGDDILNHPDLAEIDNKTKSDPAAQRDLATVDRDRASSRPEIPFSPEVREASGASSQSTDDSLSRVEDNDQNRDPNAGKALATVGAGHSPDTLRASASRNPPIFPEPMWLAGSNEFGGGRPFGNEIAEGSGNRNTDMHDNNPVARNQDGGSLNSAKPDLGTSGHRDPISSREYGSTQRDGGDSTTGRRGDGPVPPGGRRDGIDPDLEPRKDASERDTGPRRTDQDGGSPKGSPNEGGDTRVPGPHPTVDSRDNDKDGTGPSTSDKDSTDNKDSKPVSVPKDRFDAQDKAYDLLRDMDLGTGREFRNNLVDLVNSKKYGPLLERAFYLSNGHRYRTDIEINGEAIPTLVRAGDKGPWLSRDDLLPPKPPDYLFGTATGTRAGLGAAVLRKLDIAAAMRKASLIAHNPLDKRVQALKEKLKNDKSKMTEGQIEKHQKKIEVARAIRSPMAAMKTRLTESFGEKAAHRGVLDNFTGKNVTLEEVKRDKYGRIVKDENGKPIVESREVRLPKLAESTEANPNPIPASESAPKSGNSQFDQIWRTDLGDGKIGYVIVEAKSSQDTPLGKRLLKPVDGKGEPKWVSQGSREYFDEILRLMQSRGGEEATLAQEIIDKLVLEPDSIHYVEGRGNPGETGDYQGNSMRFYDIEKRRK
ncbi:hypothetical protein ACWGKS_00230 [Nocardiopsis sp. NPDC055879]